MTEACEICGLLVSRSSLSGLVQEVKNRANSGKGTWVLTLNTEMLARGARHPAYWNLLKTADVVTADGMPLVWASKVKYRGAGIAGRTTGVDLVDAILRLEEVPRFAVIGGKSPMKTIERYGLQAQESCGLVFDGKVDLTESQLSLFSNELTRSMAQVVFIALGVPKQDQLASELRQRMPHLVLLGVGGTFEILGSEGRRAPQWMQRGGLEWLYRLIQEPGRLWRRYFINYPIGVWVLVKECLLSRN